MFTLFARVKGVKVSVTRLQRLLGWEAVATATAGLVAAGSEREAAGLG